ncbi:MAG: lysophospholipid acyltransferase family protein [Lentisphaerota bacterium]
MKDGLLKSMRKRLEVAGARLGMVVLGALPRGAILLLARWAGGLTYSCSRSLRRLGMANLDLVFGDTKSASQKAAILKKSLQNFALTILDLVWFSRNAGARLEQYVSFEPEGANFFRKAAIICITGHLGNWEIMGRAVSHLGYPLWSVATPLKNPAVDGFLVKARESTGQTIVPRRGALKTLIRGLKDCQKVALLLDQNTAMEEGGRFVDFFGVPATVSPAGAALALQTQAEIMFGFCIPQPDGTYRTRFPARFEMVSVPHDSKEKAIEDLTRRITEVYEQEIRRTPECWLWTYKRWKYIRPGDTPDRYPFYARPCKNVD